MKQTACKKCGGKQMPCGCCAGVEAVTPIATANRPGLDALSYRVGTHATFLATMQARLTSEKLPELAKLTTRAASDPALALLDAWATVADVLTFYQERIANEGYLRTATERRSILELARLVGYRPRPGVAASAYLALTLDDGRGVMIEPFQLRAQSVPGLGELPQIFENVEPLEARAAWNRLRPRMTQPQRASQLLQDAEAGRDTALYLKGITTGLNIGDPLLVVAPGVPQLYRVHKVTPDPLADRTEVTIKPWQPKAKKSKEWTRLSELAAPHADAEVVNAMLASLRAQLEAVRSDAELADFIEGEMLPALERTARRSNISRAARTQLRALHTELAASPDALRLSFAPPATGGPGRPEMVSREDGYIRPDIFGADVNGNGGVIQGLATPPSIPPRGTSSLLRKAADVVAEDADLGMQMFGALFAPQRHALTAALTYINVTPPTPLEVYALRIKTAPFGHNAPPRTEVVETITRNGDEQKKSQRIDFIEWTADEVRLAEEFSTPDSLSSNVLYLVGNHEKILPGSWLVIDTSAVGTAARAATNERELLFVRAATVQANLARGGYGPSGEATRIELGDVLGAGTNVWLKLTRSGEEFQTFLPAAAFEAIRRTVVYAQSERLALAEAPIPDAICGQPPDKVVDNKKAATQAAPVGWIVLDGVYSELKSGRWVIIAGERADISANVANVNDKTVRGVRAAELAMIAEVVHGFDRELLGDSVHTRIRLAQQLAYCYRRESVTIYANVVRATHGETRRETLGSGDGSQALQRFTLRQPPLTYVSAPTPAGAESTLKIFVNDVRWHEAESICGLSPTDRRFITERSDDEVATATFGDGVRGARLPTGAENVRAEYRQGLGKGGNVNAEQISQLAARPLGVKEVINPLRAAGGADRESRDQARQNAPLAVLALDRLVSAQDYADFARTFAGVGKAYAARLSDGQRQLVHLTIAGADDAPIEPTSDLWRNLRQALRRFGDPALPFALAARERVLLLISANVRILPDYQWEKVARQLRAKLLAALSFEKRELGQDVLLSEVIAAMQSVAGVAYVDVDGFGGIAEKNPDGTVRTPQELLAAGRAIADNLNSNDPNLRKQYQRVAVKLPKLDGGKLRAAQLAYLAPEVPDLLILNQVASDAS